MSKRRGRPKGQETVKVSFRAIGDELEKAIKINSNITECCNQGLKFFNMISSGDYEIKANRSEVAN